MNTLFASSVCLSFALSTLASATVIVTNIAPLTTVPNTAGGGVDGTGVWFNPLTGYNELRGTTFPTPLFEDGKFFLVQDASFTQTEAEIYTEGFFSRGNGVVYASTTNRNPARFGDGAVVGPGVGYQSPGAGFTDLGPTFGNWVGGGHGYIGLTLRDPTGTSASDVFYGYAEISIKPSNYAITLLSFAYNNVRNAPITTAPVPEPTLLAAGIAAAGVLIRRRRR